MADRQTKELDPVKESPISGLPEILELYDETMIPVQQEDTAMHMTGKQFREFGEKTAEMYVQTAVDAAESASQSAEASEAARSASEEAAKEAADKLGEVQQAGEEALGNIEEQRQSAVTEMERLRDAAEGYKDAAAGSAADAKKDADRADDAAARAQSIAQGAKGYYATAEELTADLPEGTDGDWAIVGETDTIWVWDGDSGAWVDTRQVTEAELTEKLAGKQDVLTFDDAPTADSPNPVKSGGVYEAVKWHSNPNLLDNWYFVNPINQRGQTEYKEEGYTIDRWKWHGYVGTNLTVQNDGVTVSGNDWGQHIELIRTPPGTYTCSVLTADGKLGSLTKTFSDPETTDQQIFGALGDTDVNLNFIWKWGFPEYHITLFALQTTTPVKITAAKLELGDRQTLAHKEGDTWVLNDPPPNPATELLKCQRHYQVFATEALRPTEAEDFRPPMRIKPTKGTITVGEKTLYTADANL